VIDMSDDGPGAPDATTPSPPTSPDVAADRGLLINVAYRMLGSVTDAEDVVQETFTRWYSMSEERRAAVVTPSAWCVRVATRICIDQLKSSRRRRETYVGPWLPEPLPEHVPPRSHAAVDPADHITLDESVTMAVLTVLEAMTPAERVAFVLHDVFGYPFAEISGIVGRSSDACRQLATSARRRLRSERAHTVDSSRHASAVAGFKFALEQGEINDLITFLDPEVRVVNDGGGRVRAAVREVVGLDRVSRFLTGVMRREPEIDIVTAEVNGQPGLVFSQRGATLAVVAVDVRDGLITRLWMVLNPEKLGFWQPLHHH
jgi:RNA polymerase sigma factor (sigma-70 family)